MTWQGWRRDQNQNKHTAIIKQKHMENTGQMQAVFPQYYDEYDAIYFINLCHLKVFTG